MSANRVRLAAVGASPINSCQAGADKQFVLVTPVYSPGSIPAGNIFHEFRA